MYEKILVRPKNLAEGIKVNAPTVYNWIQIFTEPALFKTKGNNKHMMALSVVDAAILMMVNKLSIAGKSTNHMRKVYSEAFKNLSRMPVDQAVDLLNRTCILVSRDFTAMTSRDLVFLYGPTNTVEIFDFKDELENAMKYAYDYSKHLDEELAED